MSRSIVILITILAVLTVFIVKSYAEGGAIIQRVSVKGIMPGGIDGSSFEKNYKNMQQRIGMKNDIERHNYTVYDVFDDIEMPKIQEENGTALAHDKKSLAFNRVIDEFIMPVGDISEAEVRGVQSDKEISAYKGDEEVTLDQYSESASLFRGFSNYKNRQRLINEKILFIPRDDE